MANKLTWVNLICYVVIFISLGYLAYDLHVELKEKDVITQEFLVESRDSLVPPAITFCITKDLTYSFNITVHGVTTDSDYLTSYDSPYLVNLGLEVARCWIMKSPSNEAVIKKAPANKPVEDMVFTYTRFFDTPQIKTPVFVNIFDPLEVDSLFQFNRFLKLDPDINRAIHFSRTQNFNIVTKKTTNDVKYSIIDEFQDIQTSTTSSTNKITFRAVSFDIFIIRDVKRFNLNGLFRNIFTLLSSLFTTYVLLAGKGKYAPWGVIHHVFRYIPVEQVKPKNIDMEVKTFNPDEKINVIGEKLNVIEEKLSVYLSKFGDREKSRKFFF